MEMSYPSTMPVPVLSVVMPTYNECAHIERIISDWSNCLREQGIRHEMIVINDGSLDGTGRILDKLRKEMKELRVIHQLNNGHGKAVRRGYELARGEWVLQLDSSGCFDTSDFAALWAERGNANLLLGSRTHRLDSIFRRFLGRILQKFIRSSYKVEIQDPDISFRLFHRENVMPFVKAISKNVDCVNLAMSVLMKKEQPSKVIDIRIPYRLRPVGRMQTSFRNQFRQLLHTMKELMQIKVAIKVESF